MATNWLTYAEAARRMGRSKRNILRWRTEGMPVEWHVYEGGQRCRVIDEAVLLKWFREKLKNSPAHYYRMRAIAREHGLPEPARPESVDRARPKPPVLVSEAHSVGDQDEQASSRVTRWKSFEPLDTMKPMKGGPEYRELQRALWETPEPCRGVDDFTAERIDTATAAKLAGICATCPVIDLCRSYAERAHPDGYWAGITRP